MGREVIWDVQVYAVNQSIQHKKQTGRDRSAKASSLCIQKRFSGGRHRHL